MTNVTYQIVYKPEHWNPVAHYLIPAAFVAHVTVGNQDQPMWPCGTTYEEAKANVLREYPRATESEPWMEV